MIYFQNINDLEQAKLHYRTLAKRLHPDKGGSIVAFQQMQQEYKTLLLQLQNVQSSTINRNTNQNSDIINELGKLAKVLIENQLPQKLLKQRIKSSHSPIEKSIFSGIIGFLDKL